MGVSCILMWSDQADSSLNPTQKMEVLQKKVEMLGGTARGNWALDCETLQSTPSLAAGGPQKLMHMLHNSEYPRTTFAVLDSMNCLVAENSLDAIFVQLRLFYAPRKNQKIEVKGFHYNVNQYTVKFGSIVIGSANRGIIVEVEDRESVDVEFCWPALQTFTRGLLEYSPVPEPPNTNGRPYTPADRMIMYAFIFTQLRKPSVVGLK